MIRQNRNHKMLIEDLRELLPSIKEKENVEYKFQIPSSIDEFKATIYKRELRLRIGSTNPILFSNQAEVRVIP